MRRFPLILALLLAFIGSAWGAYPTSKADLWTYFAPLRAFYAERPDLVIWATGDSWTCNAQSPGEAHGWGSDLAGGGTSSSHNAIWADPTTSNGTRWMAQLAWRAKTHRFGAEAIGGAQISNNNSDPATFETDVTIGSWIDDAAEFKPDIWFFYGGINDILGGSGTLASMKRKYILAMQTAYATMPEHARMVVITLQPCGIDYVRRKMKNQAPQNGMTWKQVWDSCVERQGVVDQVNAWLKDELRGDLFDAGTSAEDTTRLFVYDHVSKLQLSHTWTAGADKALYPFNLARSVSVDGYTPIQADSVSWATLRILRREIESDSIHANGMGLRQIGDSLAYWTLGFNPSTWVAGTPGTLYVDKQNGHNWKNRGRETSRATPLASLQCAVHRAWPGDTIRVIGKGNQALLTPILSGGTGSCSATDYEVYFTKPNLYVKCEPGAYFQGVYATGVVIHKETNNPTTVGASWFHQESSSGGDWKEMKKNPSTGAIAWSLSDTTYNAIIDLGSMVIDGLDVRGYQNTVRLYNVSGVTFKNCQVIGGSASGGVVANQYATWQDDPGRAGYTAPVARRLSFEGCTFFVDSSAAVLTNTSAWGRLAFGIAGARTGNAATFKSDSTLYQGQFLNCRFIGDQWNTAQAAMSGYMDGMNIIGCLFQDYAVRYSGYTSMVHYARVCAGGTGAWAKKTKYINNTIDLKAHASATGLAWIDWENYNSAYADTMLFLNNSVTMRNGGSLTSCRMVRSPRTTTRMWFARNQIYNAGQTYPFWMVATQKTLANLITDGNAPAASGATLRECNWNKMFGYTPDVADSQRFGGILTTTALGRTWSVAPLGVSTGANHASVGATQYTHSPYLWPGKWGAYPAYAAIETPKGLIDLVTNGVLPRSDSLDVGTWYWIPQPRSFSEEAMCRAYLTHYFDMAESDQKKVRFLVQGARYLLQAPTVANIEGPWELRQLMRTGTPAECDPTDISTWIRLPQPRNAADRIMGEYYLRTWQLLPSASRDSVCYKIDGLSSMNLYGKYGVNPVTRPGLPYLLASINGSLTDQATDTDITTWQSFDAPRNEAEMLRSQVHLAQWETLAVLDRAKIRLKTR